jgi:hypothetical protein
MLYKAFISYSHAADDYLAAAVHTALHQFARRWFKLRAIRVFRDKTSLAANPGLWPSIETALRESEYFLLMAAPASAKSMWVEREVEWWVRHSSIDRLLLLLTDGDLVWEPNVADFDPTRTTSLPRPLYGKFSNEPLWVDFRWAKSAENLTLRHVQFRNAILDLAAPLHGKPKDELDGEDVRHYRRLRRTANSAAVILALLTVISVLFAYRANQSAKLAREQSEIAETRRLEAEQATERERGARKEETSCPQIRRRPAPDSG